VCLCDHGHSSSSIEHDSAIHSVLDLSEHTTTNRKHLVLPHARLCIVLISPSGAHRDLCARLPSQDVQGTCAAPEKKVVRGLCFLHRLKHRVPPCSAGSRVWETNSLMEMIRWLRCRVGLIYRGVCFFRLPVYRISAMIVFSIADTVQF